MINCSYNPSEGFIFAQILILYVFNRTLQYKVSTPASNLRGR
jgi:hypothetical protein